MDNVIAFKRARLKQCDASSEGDLLTQLMQAEDAHSPGKPLFSDRELRDNTLTFMAAGHETTSTALSWALYLLAQHPSVVATLRQVKPA